MPEKVASIANLQEYFASNIIPGNDQLLLNNPSKKMKNFMAKKQSRASETIIEEQQSVHTSVNEENAGRNLDITKTKNKYPST